MRHYSFATASATILPLEQARVFFDGTFTEPRLCHAEGVAVGPDGWIWCGTELGEIMRVNPQGDAIEKMAATDGYMLGLAFDGERALFACDCRAATVQRLDLATGKLQRFTDLGIRVPNYPLVDRRRNCLYVSDSHPSAGPSIWRYDLATGIGTAWLEAPLQFANGLAQRSGEDAVYVCETFAPAITRIPIEAGGVAGKPAVFAAGLPGLPDGIAFDEQGNLVVGCYEPSRLLRISPDGNTVEVLIEDVTAHTFCHPTNIAFAGDKLYTANLGRWHLTEVAMDIGASPIWQATAT